MTRDEAKKAAQILATQSGKMYIVYYRKGMLGTKYYYMPYHELTDQLVTISDYINP